MNPQAISGAEVAAWVAAVAGVTALLSQVVNGLRKRRREREEIEEALDRAPEVRHQLELGNVGEAVKHLNVIIESQAGHIRAQDERHQALQEEIRHLKDRNEALEAEAATWERRYRKLEREREEDKIESDQKIALLQAQTEEIKRTFARTLAQFRAEQESGEHNE